MLIFQNSQKMKEEIFVNSGSEAEEKEHLSTSQRQAVKKLGKNDNDSFKTGDHFLC